MDDATRPPMNRRRAISSASSNTSGERVDEPAWVSETCSSSSPTRTVRTPSSRAISCTHSRRQGPSTSPRVRSLSAPATPSMRSVTTRSPPSDGMPSGPRGHRRLTRRRRDREPDGLDGTFGLPPVAQRRAGHPRPRPGPRAHACGRATGRRIIAALEWVGAVASRRKVAVDLLLAATGRAALPPGFSVY